MNRIMRLWFDLTSTTMLEYIERKAYETTKGTKGKGTVRITIGEEIYEGTIKWKGHKGKCTGGGTLIRKDRGFTHLWFDEATKFSRKNYEELLKRLNKVPDRVSRKFSGSGEEEPERDADTNND